MYADMYACPFPVDTSVVPNAESTTPNTEASLPEASIPKVPASENASAAPSCAQFQLEPEVNNESEGPAVQNQAHVEEVEDMRNSLGYSPPRAEIFLGLRAIHPSHQNHRPV